MNNKLELNMNNNYLLYKTSGWMFGIAVFAIGLLNTFWGNDLEFGLFLILLSFIYFPPVNVLIEKRISFSIPLIIKIVLGIFIIVAALGVGELFDKINLMMSDI